jgi:FixJ family two-component response regulator
MATRAVLAPNVIVADDDELIRRVVRLALGSAGFTCSLAADSNQLLEILGATASDCLILDVNMPGPGVEQTLLTIRETMPSLPIILLSGTEIPVAIHVMFDVTALRKPVDLSTLLSTVTSKVGSRA